MAPRRDRAGDGPASAPVVYAKPEAVAELAQLRRRELEVLSDRLARLEDAGHKRWWTGAAATFASVGLGALLAGIPLLSSTSDWDSWVIPVYAGSVAVMLLLGGVCWLAGRSVGRERADSVAAIKTDLDRLLDAYEEPGVPAEIASNVRSHFLRRIRREVRDNRRLMEHVETRDRYWKVTDPTPRMKEWKNGRALLEGEPELERLLEMGDRAAAEVERILTTRSLRMFRGGRLRSDDRLGEAIAALSEFERQLTNALDVDGDATLPRIE